MEKYLKMRVLGEGAFGKVFLVKCTEDDRQYVMKSIELTDAERRQSLAEVRFLNQLNHPYIIGYKEYFESKASRPGQKRKLFIVMEYADGPDLASRIKAQRTPFPESQVLDWLVQILLALKHMHDRKILHRDLKSENIFSMKKNNVLKIGDFGISKSLAHTSAKAMTRIGTPYYLSPELCMGNPYNTKNDMWAVGVILYELMQRRVPFEGQSLEKLMDNIISSRHALLPRHYSKELRDVVDSLLQKSPERRPDVHNLLQLPFIASLISNHLPAPIMRDEFAHTVLHNNGRRHRPAKPPGLGNDPSLKPKDSADRTALAPRTNLDNINNLVPPANDFAAPKEDKKNPITPSRLHRAPSTPILDRDARRGQGRPQSSPAQRVKPKMKFINSTPPRPARHAGAANRPFTSPQAMGGGIAGRRAIVPGSRRAVTPVRRRGMHHQQNPLSYNPYMDQVNRARRNRIF